VTLLLSLLKWCLVRALLQISAVTIVFSPTNFVSSRRCSACLFRNQSCSLFIL
jgi:hypothetical protein